jgi:hypothetical protein
MRDQEAAQIAESVAVPRDLLLLAVEAMNRCQCAHAVRDASESVDAALEVFEQLLGLPIGWLPGAEEAT